jgi:hypothetical protein
MLRLPMSPQAAGEGVSGTLSVLSGTPWTPHRVFQPELRHPCPDLSLRPVRLASSYGIADFFLGLRLSGIIATARRRATGSGYSFAFCLPTGGRQRCSRATPPPSKLSLHVDEPVARTAAFAVRGSSRRCESDAGQVPLERVKTSAPRRTAGTAEVARRYASLAFLRGSSLARGPGPKPAG